VGSDGETVSSDRAGKTVLWPLSTGLTVFPLSIGLLVFWASAAVPVRMMAPRPISPMRDLRSWLNSGWSPQSFNVERASKLRVCLLAAFRRPGH